MPRETEVAQTITQDGRTYDLSLRWKRIYKPYAITLDNFEHKKYAGTDKPKDFRSYARLTDPERGDDRETQIYMNHPLRYQGETFYQSGYLPGGAGTVLQVVRNPGWLMPYISCTMVALGMLVHFGLHLVQFIRVKVAS